MTLIALNAQNKWTERLNDVKNEVLSLDNTVELPEETSEGRIELHFPKFSDGRAFSQAALLRRSGYRGDIRATGDVLVDQLLQMQRCGFSSAQLRADQKPELAEKLLSQFSAFYQGDALQPAPKFARSDELEIA